MEQNVILIGIISTFVIGVINVVVTVTQNRKNSFLEIVTKSRKEYINRLRELVASFCTVATLFDEKNDKKKLIELAYQLKVMMNPAGYIKWDREAVVLIDCILESRHKKDIDNFLALMESWLALEWHGMMNEGRYGKLKGTKKSKLRNEFHTEYETYNKSENNKVS